MQAACNCEIVAIGAASSNLSEKTSFISWKSGISSTLKQAEAQISLSATNTTEFLAVLILSNDPQQLCCALKSLADHVSHWTPIDVFIFSLQDRLQTEAQNCTPMLDFRTVFLELKEHWETPEEAESSSTWTSLSFASDSYRRMGHWRLAFQMEFAARLGYKYILQIDDDAALLEPLKIDLVDYMRTNEIYMGARNIQENDMQDVTLGLAELAKKILVTERLQPADLFASDCAPPDITGLYTRGLGGPDTGGYSTRYLYGSFVIISLDFWFREQVQRFVRLVLRTGAHFRYRWNEQQVQSMVWHIFVLPDHFHQFDFDYMHPKKPWTC